MRQFLPSGIRLDGLAVVADLLAVVGQMFAQLLALAQNLGFDDTALGFQLAQLPTNATESRGRWHSVGSMRVPLIRTLAGLELEAKRQHQMRISLQFASKRLGAAMLQNAHCIERTQHPFDRSVLSPAAVSQLFDLACQISQVQLVKDVSERFQSAVLQMHFPEHIGLNDSHWHAPFKGLNWPPMIQEKGFSMSIIYNKNKYMY